MKSYFFTDIPTNKKIEIGRDSRHLFIDARQTDGIAEIDEFQLDDFIKSLQEIKKEIDEYKKTFKQVSVLW